MDSNLTKNVSAPSAPQPMAGADERPEAAGGKAFTPGGRGRRADTVVSNSVAYVLLLLGAALFMLPFLYLVSTAVKSVAGANEFPPRLLPYKPVTTMVNGEAAPVGLLRGTDQYVAQISVEGDNVTVVPLDEAMNPAGPQAVVEVAQVERMERIGVYLENFPEALTMLPFARFFLNTLIIVVLTVFGATFSAALCAYGFARLRFRGREPLFVILLATMMIPGQVTMIPIYILFKELGWINTFLPLIVPAWFGGGAFSIFLLRQFFRSIPFEMEEAARIDGSGPLATWWRIILPLSFPAMATVSIFTFMGAWNDFMGPLIYLNDTELFTLALGLSLFRGQYGVDTPHLMMAATLVVLIPILVLFFVAQKYFIQGIVVSGVKG
jgi:multiple sugar transport system permease protein